MAYHNTTFTDGNGHRKAILRAAIHLEANPAFPGNVWDRYLMGHRDPDREYVNGILLYNESSSGSFELVSTPQVPRRSFYLRCLILY